MGLLCGGLKRKNHIAVGYNTFHSYLGYLDHLISTDAIQLQKMIKQIIEFFDLFHYHYGVSIWPDFRDLEMILNKQKKIVMHHWGNDVRFHNLARINNSYVYTGDSPPNDIIHEKLSLITKYITTAIVQDYEVLPYVSNYYQSVHVLPLAIDLRKFQPNYPSNTETNPLILHAPTNPDFKGTIHIEAALEKLKKKHCFTYKRIEKMNHSEVVNYYKKADLIIDQILCGSHGLLSVEAMALGKPVIAYIRPDLVSKFPSELPIINANPSTIELAIEEFLENTTSRTDIGQLGRRYVEKYHSRDHVIDSLLAIYNTL